VVSLLLLGGFLPDLMKSVEIMKSVKIMRDFEIRTPICGVGDPSSGPTLELNRFKYALLLLTYMSAKYEQSSKVCSFYVALKKSSSRRPQFGKIENCSYVYLLIKLQQYVK